MSNNGSTATVTLGERVFPVVPQRHARLRHNLSASDFQSLMTGNYGVESKRILTVLIPLLDDMPEYEWEGFGSVEALEAYRAGDRDAYDEEQDKSPTTDQILGAFETALNVSGASRLGKLIRLVNSAGTVMEATGGTPTPLSPASPGSTGD